jgi:hypothetical protein
MKRLLGATAAAALVVAGWLGDSSEPRRGASD